MSINYADIVMSSSSSSNKVLLEGSGTMTVAGLSGQGETHTIATIAHNYGSDNLLFQVSTNGGPTNGVMLPWESNDGRSIQWASVDATNLYITVNSNNSGSGTVPSYIIDYFYRILVP